MEEKKSSNPKPSSLQPLLPPIKMTFPDGKEYAIKYWKDMIISTAVHFINLQKLVITEEIKDFINTTPYTRKGNKYRGFEKFDNYYINTWFTSWQLQDNADLLMKTNNIDPNSIKYKTADGGKYVKPTKSLMSNHDNKKKAKTSQKTNHGKHRQTR